MSVIKHIVQLHQKKYRYEFGEFLVEGVKGVQEALQYAEVNTIIIDQQKEQEIAIADIIYDAKQKGIDVVFVGEKEIKKIKTTETFPGIMAVVAMPKILSSTLSGPIVCLDGIHDPGNLGTIIRTADWFGVEHIILSETCVDPYNEKVVRSSMGSVFRVNVHQPQELVPELTILQQEKGYQLVGLSLDGESLSQFHPTDTSCYVFGSESHGLSPHLEKILNARYTQGKGRAESLNVAIAAGIILSRI